MIVSWDDVRETLGYGGRRAGMMARTTTRLMIASASESWFTDRTRAAMSAKREAPRANRHERVDQREEERQAQLAPHEVGSRSRP